LIIDALRLNYFLGDVKMNTFKCKHKKESWSGSISAFKNFGTHYEFWIQSRSSIMVIFGKTSRGYFACMPDFNVGCHLVQLNDFFWNKERLTQILGAADGITVASSLVFLANDLKYPEF
jgi:hypothetical protein